MFQYKTENDLRYKEHYLIIIYYSLYFVKKHLKICVDKLENNNRTGLFLLKFFI